MKIILTEEKIYDWSLLKNVLKILKLFINRNFNGEIDFLRYKQLKTGIEHGAKSVNNKIFDRHLSDFRTPRLPLLLKCSIAVNKGCSFFYAILRARELQKQTTSTSELKWQAKTGSTFSVRFWDKIFKLPSKSILNNKMIWTQIQLNKHLLPTNYTVNKYDQSVSPLCSFCSQHPEELHLLMWGCGVVREFWLMVANFLSNFYPNFILGRKEALFGDNNSSGSSAINTILLLARYFIWKQKFTKKDLDEVLFINYLSD